MGRDLAKPVHRVSAALVTAALASGVWAAWLGWDQHRDVHPDGTTTGPYAAWQVVGLVVTLLLPAYAIVARYGGAVYVLGTTAGLGVAAGYDWSDDSSGLFVIGVGLVVAGSLAATALVSAVVTPMTHRGTRRRT
ncbi:hypothetical protein ACFWAR_38545 [Streptomyces sp. NPDC059917]|uniref:hypothetical protein n=1 Tax=Streptomyces sp. NPDC059917 TaxID=3347002 RepID=UPI003663E4D5